MNGILNAADIDKDSASVTEYLKLQRISDKEIIRMRLGIEDALLRFRDRFGEVPFSVRMGRLMSKVKISVSVEGEMFDPFTKSGDGESENELMRNALVNAGELPVWRYAHGVNTLTFSRDKKKLPDWAQLLISIVCAVLLSAAMKPFSPELGYNLNSNVFQPLATRFLGLLMAVATPMIFLSVICGICNMGNAATFSVLGKKLAARSLIYGVLIPLCIVALSFPLYHFVTGTGTENADLSSVYTMILEICPDNLITPFTTGNYLQVMFLGVITGLVMLLISEKVQSVASLLNQLNSVIQVIMSGVVKLLPLYIFLSVAGLLLDSRPEGISNTGKMFTIITAAELLFCAIVTLIVSVKMKISPLRLLKRSWKTLLTAAVTCSSSATLPMSVEECTKKHGIHPNLTNFGLPLYQTIQKPSIIIQLTVFALYVANNNGIPVSAVWMIKLAITSVILTVAAPPIPGSMAVVYTVLIAQMGLPSESIGAAMALSALTDFISTLGNVLCRTYALIPSARDFGMLDMEVFRK